MTNSRFTTGQTITKEMHLYAVPRRPFQSVDEPAWTYTLLNYGPRIHSETTDVHIGMVEVAFDVPGGVDLLDACVENLRSKQNDIKARAHREVAEIEEQIKSMLLIEHQPAAEAREQP